MTKIGLCFANGPLERMHRWLGAEDIQNPPIEVIINAGWSDGAGYCIDPTSLERTERSRRLAVSGCNNGAQWQDAIQSFIGRVVPESPPCDVNRRTKVKVAATPDTIFIGEVPQM